MLHVSFRKLQFLQRNSRNAREKKDEKCSCLLKLKLIMLEMKWGEGKKNHKSRFFVVDVDTFEIIEREAH